MAPDRTLRLMIMVSQRDGQVRHFTLYFDAVYFTAYSNNMLWGMAAPALLKGHPTLRCATVAEGYHQDQ